MVNGNCAKMPVSHKSAWGLQDNTHISVHKPKFEIIIVQCVYYIHN